MVPPTPHDEALERPGLLLLKGDGYAYGEYTDFLLRGFVLPDRSGQFNSKPYLMIPAQRSGDIPMPDLGNVIIKPNIKVIFTDGNYGTPGKQNGHVRADSAWMNTEVIVVVPVTLDLRGLLIAIAVGREVLLIVRYN